MQYDQDKADEIALALLYLTRAKMAARGKEWIERPTQLKGAFQLPEEGQEACIRFFRKHFGLAEDEPSL